MSRMRRSLLTLSVVTVGTALCGCDAILNFFPTTNNETGKSQLLPFASEKAYSDYMRDQIGQRNGSLNSIDGLFRDEISIEAVAEDAASGAGGADNAAPSAPSADGGTLAGDDGGTGSNFSETTIQEVGVDEADVVKTDGNFLYVLTSNGANSVLRIIDVADSTALVEVSRTELDGFGRDFYLYGDTVVALTSSGGGFFFADGGGGISIAPVFIDSIATEDIQVVEANEAGESRPASDDPDGATQTLPDESADESGVSDGAGGDVIIEPVPGGPDGFVEPDYRYTRPTITVSVIDVTDRTTPSINSTTRFDGSIASSRMIDGVLHLVAANYQDYYVDVLPLLGASELEPTTIDTAELLPSYRHTDIAGAETSGDVLTWESLYRPTDPDGFGVVYVASIDIDDNASFSAVGVVAEPGLVYSSLNALYLTDTEYDFSGGRRTTTDVYKFAYVDRGATPTAAGSVAGRILNQYSMSEYNGFLRVATTVDATFSAFGQRTAATNQVYVLGESEATLDVVGSVGDIAPRETIQSARFVGDKGFVVTFEQIDPLFTLDLSDPTNPRVVGELKVPGFSTFLVPIDAGHLLAVGQDVPPPGQFGPRGVQLSIFDVTDFAQPRLMDRATIGGDTGAYSEAFFNPKAFTYFAERGTVALPVSIYNNVFVFEDDLIAIDADGSGSSSGGSGSSDSADAPPPDDVVVSDPDDGDLVGIEPFVPEGFEGLLVFDVSLDSGLTEIGRISTRFPDEGIYWSSYTRGVFIGDEVLAVTDNGVRGAPVSDIEADQFELVFDRTNGQDKGDSSIGGEESPPVEVEAADGSTDGDTGQ